MTPQQKRCDDIWARCIKKRANYTSEISGECGNGVILEAHHIHGKANFALRYSLLSGICITNVEHNYHAHGHENHGRTRQHPYAGRSLYKKFRENVKKLRGEDIYERLQEIKDDRKPVDLFKIEEMLKAKLKEL